MLDIKPISLNQIIAFSAAEFTDFELQISNGLSNALSEAYNLDVDGVGVVVDMDYGNPLVKMNAEGSTGDMEIGFSGRFYPHDVDKDGNQIVDANWGNTITAFFQESEIPVKMDDSNAPIKFSFTLACLSWESREDSSAEPSGKGPGGDSEEAEPADEPGDAPGGEAEDESLDDLLGEEPEEKEPEEKEAPEEAAPAEKEET